MARKPLITPGSILPAAESPPPPQDDLLSRIVANDRARHRPPAEPPAPASRNKTDNITENMTSNTPSNPTNNMTGQPTGNVTSHITHNTTSNLTHNITSNPTNNTTSSPTSNTASNITNKQASPRPAAQVRETRPAPTATPLRSGIASLADQIRQETLAAGLARMAKPAPLKVVTLKLPPDLDLSIERHCWQSGRKKQDVLRDALLLYLEVVNQTEGEDGEGEK
jgi:hypothetical protein